MSWTNTSSSLICTGLPATAAGLQSALTRACAVFWVYTLEYELPCNQQSLSPFLTHSPPFLFEDWTAASEGCAAYRISGFRVQKTLSNKENPLLHMTNNFQTSWSRAHEFSPASSSTCSDSCICHQCTSVPGREKLGLLTWPGAWVTSKMLKDLQKEFLMTAISKNNFPVYFKLLVTDWVTARVS